MNRSTSDIGLEALTASDSGAGGAVALMGALAAGAGAVAAIQFAPLPVPMARAQAPAPYVPRPSYGAYNDYGAAPSGGGGANAWVEQKIAEGGPLGKWLEFSKKMDTWYKTTTAGKVYSAGSVVSYPVLGYHGYKRNDSLLWAIGWAIAPIPWPLMGALAASQGYAEPAKP